MERGRIKEQTSLIEWEDDLFAPLETSQQLLSAAWLFLRTSDDPIHFLTAKFLMLG